MNRLLSEPLALRTSAVLGSFAGHDVLSHRFGDLRQTRFPLFRLSDTEWFAADHPMPITETFVDDQKTLGFDVQIRGDDVGNTYTVVRLAAPAKPGAKISASGLGRRDPVSGELLQNPADIMEFILRLAGRDEVFPLLRAECAAAGIVLAGSLDRVQSIRAWLDEIAYSSGAIWTTEAACLYPIVYTGGRRVDLDRKAAYSVKPASQLDDTADVLHLSYDMNDATGQPGQFVELTASPQRFGGIVVERTLRWLRQSANAETIGKRMLARMAGERYTVTYSTDQYRMRPCRWTRLVDHPQWFAPGDDPTLMTVAVDVDLQTKRAAVTAETVRSSPAIEVTAHSIALPSTTSPALAVAFSDGVATFTAFDQHGDPVKNALVSLDGLPAKKTNEEGRVSFNVAPASPPRAHQVVFAAPGFLSQTLQIFL